MLTTKTTFLPDCLLLLFGHFRQSCPNDLVDLLDTVNNRRIGRPDVLLKVVEHKCLLVMKTSIINLVEA